MDSSQNQVADVEVALVDVAIMIAPELLFISRVLYGGRQAVLLSRVDVGASSQFGFVFVIVLDARSTKSYVRWLDYFRTVHHEEWRIAGSPASLCAEPPDYSRYFLEPLCTIFFDRIENSGLEPLEDQAVGPFDLATAPGVRHRGIVDIDEALLAVVPELRTREQGTQVGNDPIRHSEPV